MDWVDVAQIALTSGVVSAIVSGTIGYFSGRKLQEERRVYEHIQKVYFEEGISHIMTAVSEYGTGTVFALVDLNTWVNRSQRAPNKSSLLEYRVREIRERKSVSELINRDLKLAIKWFPKLRRFGMPLYGAVKRTFQFYGRILMDTLEIDNLKSQTKENIPAFTSGLMAMTKILQLTESYLEARLNGITEYVWKRKYGTYADFLKVTNEEKYQALLVELQEYRGKLDAWSAALTSPNPDDRKRTSSSFGMWLNKHIEKNPLD